MKKSPATDWTRMKIGVVTHCLNTLNYGACLQAYALQSYLRSIGHDPYLVRYEGGRRDLTLLSFVPLSRHGLSGVWNRVCRITDSIPFRKFKHERLRLSPIAYRNLDDLRGAPPDADAYICGSDQIWSPVLVEPSEYGVYWLGFGRTGIRRIAYAASIGVNHLDEVTVRRYAELSKCLDFLSVRESWASDMISNLAGCRTVQSVLDPVLLVSRSTFQNIEQHPFSPLPGRPYIFTYMLWGRAEKTAQAVAKHIDAELVVSEAQPFLGPEQWIYSLRRSRLVITRSFHGVAFSILFNIPFVVVPHDKVACTKASGRVSDILEKCGLTDRFVAEASVEAVAKAIDTPIDWQMVNDRLAAHRRQSEDYLLGALATEMTGSDRS
jgi:hypothetical protein